MAEPAPLTPDETLLWQSLGRLVHALPRVLEEDMGRTGVSMTEFAVLLTLSQAPDKRVRMSELATATGLTPSRITRVVDGLRAHGLVLKERHGADARSNNTVLTEEGERRVRSAQPVHLGIARDRVLRHVPDDVLPQLAEVLRRVTEVTIDARTVARGD